MFTATLKLEVVGSFETLVSGWQTTCRPRLTKTAVTVTGLVGSLISVQNLRRSHIGSLKNTGLYQDICYLPVVATD